MSARPSRPPEIGTAHRVVPSAVPTAPRIHRIEITPLSIVYVLAAAVAVWLAMQLWIIGLLLVVTLVFVGSLNPVVTSLEKKGMPRMRALLLVFSALAIVGVLLLVLTIPPFVEQVSRIAQDAPAHRLHLIALLERNPQTVPLARAVRDAGLQPLIDRLQETLLGYSGTAVEVVGYGVTTLFLAFYLLADGKRTQGALYAVVPRDFHMRLARILHNLEVIVGGYMRGQVITSAAIAAFTFVLLVACGVPNALSLALFAGLTDVIPFVGGFLATGPAFLSALPRGMPIAVGVLLALGAYQEFENRVLVPRVYGRALRLSPAMVVIALLAGGMLLGVMGALLALPIAAGLQMILAELRVDMPGDDSDDPNARARNDRTEATYEKMSAGSTAPEAGQIASGLAQENREADATAAITQSIAIRDRLEK